MNMMTQQIILSKDMMHTQHIKSLILTFRFLFSNIFRVSIYNVGMIEIA